MAHAMVENDIQHGIELAWHKLTTIKTSDQLALDGFPFEYQKTPIQVEGVDIPGYYWLKGTDDGKLIGEPQFKSFGYLTNAQLMGVVRETLKGTGATISSLGTFGGRAKRYVSIRVGSEWDTFTVGNRKFQNFLNIQDALDGTMKLIAKGSNICTVCYNTFSASLKETSDFRFSLRHSSGHTNQDRIDNFQSAIDAYHGASALFKGLFESADQTPISQKTARHAFAGFLGEGNELATQSRNKVDRLVNLFNHGRGNAGQTGADLLSAVTDFYTHESSGRRGLAAQIESSEMGAASRSKVEFFEAVSTRSNGWQIDTRKIDQLANLGERSLSVSLAN